MRNGLRRGVVSTAAAVFVVGVALAPIDAAAHGGGRVGGVRVRGTVAVVGGGYHAPWFAFGPYAFAPWGSFPWDSYPPAFYQPEGGVSLGYAGMSGYGGVDLDVKPNRAEVWVDGKYAGEARDLDGYPSYLWLKEGVHRIQVYKGGFRTFDEEIEVDRGMKKDLRIRLEPGQAMRPVRRPPEDKGGSNETEGKPSGTQS